MKSETKEKDAGLKLLIVTPYFHPKVGGLENYTYNIAKGLKEKYNWEIVVVTSNHEQRKNSVEQLDSIKVLRLARWFKISNTPINPMWYFQISRIIKKENPDIINTHSPVPFISDIAAMVCGKIPLILTYHTGPIKLKGNLFEDSIIKFYEFYVLKNLLNKAKKIICTSDYIRLDFLQDYMDKTVTVTPGVDLNRFKPKAYNSSNTILFIGGLHRGDKHKGLTYLLYAITKICNNTRDIKLIIVGSGDYSPKYKILCKNLGIEKNVEFKGKLTGESLVELFQKSNVLVQPSLSESFGIVFLEAMACKKPVIGTDIDGIPYVIENGKNGLTVPPKDPEALAKAITIILNNPKLAERMGEEGYKKVIESFTWDRQVSITNTILRSIINNRKVYQNI